MSSRIYRAVSVTGAGQVIASAGAHYLPAVIAIPASRELALSPAILFAGFSIALGVSALAGPFVGKMVDRFGGRPVLMSSNLIFALGLTCLGFSEGMWSVLFGYAILGLGMAAGLFEVAFSAIVRLFGKNSRNPITGVTLIAGFASLVAWTVSVYVESKFGWNGVCWFWACVHILVGLPLNALLPSPLSTSAVTTAVSNTPLPSASASSSSPPITDPAPIPSKYTAFLLAFVFAANSFVGMGLMIHMPRMLEGMGVPLAVAFTIGALVGPSQVLGRLIDFFFMRRWHPLVSTRLAALTHPIGGALLLVFGAPFALAFVILHGIGNGILIIARGTLPLAIFGTKGYGQRQGWLMMPSKFAQAAAPFLFGLALTDWGSNVLWLSWSLGLSVFVALCMISTKYRPT
ncbi:MAG: MFS transporter [Burkholderiaceae bacterium]|nr:MFS transporter [Burkholderiaceae bacterium]